MQNTGRAGKTNNSTAVEENTLLLREQALAFAEQAMDVSVFIFLSDRALEVPKHRDISLQIF